MTDLFYQENYENGEAKVWKVCKPTAVSGFSESG